ncbi:hypothetical protein [Nocardioides baculatus]|uniref:PPE domain-containing protein n=1 Tax=Nocardioides baculatus TaxID=2801337 RepID=A0ABS1L5S2_9ACTN|nr:hypothetical protein [Nocardioides baculatus]MBL0747041.1 hypothetical protein [Nocardioides baculatus]
MPANPWELRADVRPLEVAASRWADIGALMVRRGDEIVEAARRATEGWDAAAAESYEQHRRQVLANLDRFTTLAVQISGSLRAISSILTSSQKELDQAWTKVALVPHEVVGEQRYLVFKPEDDEGRGKVDHGKVETEEIRARLAQSLDQESARLRTARAEFVLVRTELTTLTGGTFGRRIGPGVGPGFGPDGEESGVGTVLPSTSVLGSAQSGVTAAGLPPVAPISVDMPRLTGLSAAALTPFVASAAAGLSSRGGRRTSSGPPQAAGGMGMGGAMGARAGTMSRGMASGRAGTRRLATPRLEGEDDAAAAARAKQAEKDAKRAALEEKRAERAARKAEREKGKGKRDTKDEDTNDEDERPDDEVVDESVEETRRPAVIVVEVAPGEEPPPEAVPTGEPTHSAPDAGPGEQADAEGADERCRS